MVPAYSGAFPTPPYSRIHYNIFRLQDSHLLWSAFPKQFCLYVKVLGYPGSLATTHGITIVFFSSRYLDVFSSPGFSSFTMITGLQPAGFPIRTSTDQACFATPRGFFSSLPRPSSSPRARHPPCALIRSFPFLNFSSTSTLHLVTCVVSGRNFFPTCQWTFSFIAKSTHPILIKFVDSHFIQAFYIKQDYSCYISLLKCGGIRSSRNFLRDKLLLFYL